MENYSLRKGFLGAGGRYSRMYLPKIFAFIKKNPGITYLMVILLLLPCIYLGTLNTVTVYVDGQPYAVLKTNSRTVSEVLQEIKIDLHPCDWITPSSGDLLHRKSHVSIEKAFPVTIYTRDLREEIWTTALTVDELLRQEGHLLGAFDRVSPDPGYKLRSGDTVRIVKVEKEHVTEKRAIPFQVAYRPNILLDRGLFRNIEAGADGLEEVTIRITYEDGEEVGREVVEAKIITPPSTRIVEQGANTVLSRGGITLEFVKAMYVRATAYCPGTPGSGCPINSRGHAFCTGPALGYTRTGMRAVAGDGSRENPHIIAVDPSVIPLRSLVYIEGYGFATAQDTGGVIKGNRIDLLFDLHEEALRFRVKQLKIYLLR